jgi:putative nucleotidyltransferase with HDIG domain
MRAAATAWEAWPNKGEPSMPASPNANAAAEMIGKPLPDSLKSTIGEVTEISSLPEITTKIVQVVEDPRATAKDMHDIVRTDPALAAKILKVVNSAFYGLPSQIGSLDRAILMLGLSAVKNIALAASLSRMFKAEAVSDQFTARDLWRHSIAVGVCARELAAKAGHSELDEIFVAGLVHDMGLIISQQIFADKLREIINACFDTPQDFCAAEEREIGADHQCLGATLAARWKFPPGLRAAIAYHHSPDQLPDAYRKQVIFIHVADTLCSRQRFGFWLTGQEQDFSSDLLIEIGLTDEAVAAVLEELEARVEEAERVFTE